MPNQYHPVRVLVRGLRPLPGQSADEFRANVQLLKRHFEQFNADVSGVCRWLMGFRPGGKRGFGDKVKPFWNFFLKPEETFQKLDADKLNQARLLAFKAAAAWVFPDKLDEFIPPPELTAAINSIADEPLKPGDRAARKLFERLDRMSNAHLTIILKSAADWVYARYLRLLENQPRHYELWLKEKHEWEEQHPELNDALRDRYGAIFTELGVKIKNPRICELKQLNLNYDNCRFGSQGVTIWVNGKFQGHHSRCKHFFDFKRLKKGNGNFKNFLKNLQTYLNNRVRNQDRKRALMNLFKKKTWEESWFSEMLEDYLKAIGLNEEKLVSEYETTSSLPHCTDFTNETSCRFSPHTENCKKYRCLAAERLNPGEQDLEELYRKWRKAFLVGPPKPIFRYPSSKLLSVPKIFGSGYFKPDFAKSTLEVRLEDDRTLQFGFTPWPPNYDIQPEATEITSVAINFVGTRPRAGFHLKVLHKKSRFNLTQNELDDLRQREYPRPSQDAEYTKAARALILNKFIPEQPELKMRVLVVDTGTAGGAFACFEGKKPLKEGKLKIIKVAKNLDDVPDDETEKGLTVSHIGKHRDALQAAAKELSEHRHISKATLRRYDNRKLVLHMRWMIRDWVRLNTRQIILIAEEFDADLILFESHRDFTLPSYNEVDSDNFAKKQRLAIFSPARIRAKVREKAVERGMLVMTVPEFQSSKRCNLCGSLGHKNTRTRKFTCSNRSCENRKNPVNSDINAVLVLARVFWGDKGFDPQVWQSESKLLRNRKKADGA